MVWSGTSVSTTNGQVSAPSKGSTISGVTTVTTAIAKATMNGKSGTTSFDVKQAANAATTITYGVPTVTLSVADIPAAGGTISSGTVSYSQSRTQNYTSGATSALSPLTSGGTVSYSEAVSAPSLGTTVKSRTSVGSLKATVSMNGKSGSGSASVYQQANVATYGTVKISGGSVADIPASGGSVSSVSSYTTSQTVSYTSGSSRAGEITITYSTPVSASSLGTTVKVRTSVGTLTLTATGEGSKSASKQYTVYQAANSATYGVPNVTLSVSDIPASGGTISSGTVSYSQRVTFTSGSTSNITSGGSVSYSDAVIAPSLGTTVKSRSSVGTLTATVTLNGKSGSGSATVYQSANSVTYGAVAISGGSVLDIPASGGTISSMSGISASQTVSYTSGSTRPGSVNITYSTAVTAASKGTTVSNRSSVGTLTATATGEGTKSASKSLTVYQVGNYVTKINYSGGTFSYPTIGAGATSAEPSVVGTNLTYTYSSGSVGGQPDSTYGTHSISIVFSLGSVVNGFTEVNRISGVLTATNRGTTVGNARTSGVVTRTVTRVWTHAPEYSAGGTVTGTHTLTATCTQAANTLTWGTPVILRTTPVSIAATGGTNNVATGLTYSQTGTYSSGSTTTASSGGSLSYSVVTPVSGFSLSGSTVTATNNTSLSARNGFVVRISLTLNGKSATKDITYNQAAGYYTYANPVVSATCADVPAKGGSVTSGTATYSQTYGWNGATSGAGTVSSGGNVSWSGGASNIPSLGTTVKVRSIVGSKLVATVTLNGKTGKASIDVYQQANVATYGALAGGSVSAADIPASGGSRSASITNMTQTVSYTSGATRAGTVTNSQTAAITGSNLGTTEKARTKAGTITVTFSGEGSKTAQKSVNVYQQANTKTYGAITIASFSYPAVAATGATSTPSVGAVTQATSFTSGATSSETISARAYSIPTAVSGASINSTSGVITWAANNSTSSRKVTARLTVTANGKTATKDATCTQNAGVKTYANPVVSLSYPVIPAAGGTVSPTISYSQSWGWNGATTGGGTITSGGTVVWSGTSVSTTNGQVSAPSKGTTVSDITTVTTATAKVTLNGKSGSKAATVKQQANSLTWNTPTITYTYADISAAGGTVTPSVSITQSGSYTSGNTASNTVIGSKSFSGTGVNTSTGAYTAASLGTTVKTRTKLSTGTVSVTANGKTATKTANIYQAENKIVRYNYGTWTIAISANPTTIAYSGGTSTISASCTRSKTPVYSSGATGTAGSERATPTLSGSATGFTLSGTTVTASANSMASTRSITVTAAYSGATSKSVKITQAAAPATISLNVSTLSFTQRSNSKTVSVTSNSVWNVKKG